MRWTMSSSPYFAHLLELIRDFEAADRAVLGICLGSQLLARAFGGAEPDRRRHRIRLAADLADASEARADPVLGALPQQFPLFQWHDDTFSLPAGAVRLAGNDAVANQAFRIGRAAYGIQFHFEADSSVVRRWNETFAGLIAEQQPDWPARYASEAAAHAAAADATGLAIARAWVAAI